jgi:PIN domain nuclease of toxin-antitoxin system
MRLLLDTHVFLWFISGDSRLPIVMKEAISDPENDVFLSVISLWETIIKYQLGKMSLPQPPETYLPVQRERHAITSLPLNEACTSQVARLPAIHRDPFDRMLIAQAIEFGLTMVTADAAIRAYPVAVFLE